MLGEKLTCKCYLTAVPREGKVTMTVHASFMLDSFSSRSGQILITHRRHPILVAILGRRARHPTKGTSTQKTAVSPESTTILQSKPKVRLNSNNLQILPHVVGYMKFEPMSTFGKGSPRKKLYSSAYNRICELLSHTLCSEQNGKYKSWM